MVYTSPINKAREQVQRASAECINEGRPVTWKFYRNNVVKKGLTYIQRYGQGIRETVSEATTRSEAQRDLAEYRQSDPSAHYYLSSRPCKGWDDTH